jgi:hypothetical protein
MSDEQTDASSARRSRIIIGAIVGLTLLISGVWIGVNISFTDEMAAGFSKEYAKSIEDHCRRQGHGKRACRSVIGRHHIRCFRGAEIENEETRTTGLLAYDESKYRACMIEEIEALEDGEDPHSTPAGIAPELQ